MKDIKDMPKLRIATNGQEYRIEAFDGKSASYIRYDSLNYPDIRSAQVSKYLIEKEYKKDLGEWIPVEEPKL